MTPESLTKKNNERLIERARRSGQIVISDVALNLRMHACRERAVDIRNDFTNFWNQFRVETDTRRVVVNLGRDKWGAERRIEVARGGYAIGYVMEGEKSVELVSQTLGSSNILQDRNVLSQLPIRAGRQQQGDVTQYQELTEGTLDVVQKQWFADSLEEWTGKAAETMETLWAFARNDELNPDLASRLLGAQATTAV